MLTLFLTLIAMLSSPLTAKAERPQVPRDRVVTIGTELRYFDSSANFRSNGLAKTLLPGASLQNMQGEANAALEWAKHWRVFSSLSYSQTQATNGTASSSGSGLNEIGAGAQYWFNPGAFSIIPQIQTLYPLTRVDEASNKALINDGAARFEAGAYGIWRLRSFQPFAYGGYAYRDTGRSALLNYSLGAYWRPGSFWLQGEYRGYTSVSDDSDSSTDGRGLRDVFLSRVNGGSYRFFTVNPTLNEAAVSAGYYLGHGWKIYSGFAMAVNGNDSAKGWTATAGASYAFRLPSANSQPPSVDEGETSGQFHPDSEKYDESLFSEENGGKVKKRVRKTPSVDKLLNETEKKLNSKSNEQGTDESAP